MQKIFTSLKGKKDFAIINEKGKTFVTRTLIIRYMPALEREVKFELGLIVSKKHGNAVIRNKIRRRIKEAFFALAKELKLPAYNFLIIPRALAKEKSFLEFQDELRFFSNKSGILRLDNNNSN